MTVWLQNAAKGVLCAISRTNAVQTGFFHAFKFAVAVTVVRTPGAVFPPPADITGFSVFHWLRICADDRRPNCRFLYSEAKQGNKRMQRLQSDDLVCRLCGLQTSDEGK